MSGEDRQQTVNGCVEFFGRQSALAQVGAVAGVVDAGGRIVVVENQEKCKGQRQPKDRARSGPKPRGAFARGQQQVDQYRSARHNDRAVDAHAQSTGQPGDEEPAPLVRAPPQQHRQPHDRQHPGRRPVRLGDDHAPPVKDAGRQRGRSQQSRHPPAAHQPHDQVDVGDRQRAEGSRHQVDAIGNIPERQEGEQLAEDDLRGIAAGMRHPERVGERLEFGHISVKQRRCQRADI